MRHKRCCDESENLCELTFADGLVRLICRVCGALLAQAETSDELWAEYC